MMKFLTFAFFGILAFAPSVGCGQEVGYDHERLTTNDGRAYHEVFVLGSDANGLTFRHRDGIAKVGFGQLSEAYRMLYEMVAELPDMAIPAEPSSDPREVAAIRGHAIDMLDREPLILLARNRFAIPLPAATPWCGGGLSHLPQSAWPTWWPDHGRIHRLTHPLFREYAVRGFLISSGLLSRPGCW